MRKLFPILLMCFGVSGAFAQADRGGVTVSNDPAKVAAVERHADELKARAAQQQAQGAGQYESRRQEVSRPTRASDAFGEPPRPLWRWTHSPVRRRTDAASQSA